MRESHGPGVSAVGWLDYHLLSVSWRKGEKQDHEFFRGPVYRRRGGKKQDHESFLVVLFLNKPDSYSSSGSRSHIMGSAFSISTKCGGAYLHRHR